MQPVLIDLDRLTDFLFVVRIRGYLCEAVNPLRIDMAIFDERICRADHPSEKELRRAVEDLANRMLDAMFGECEAWQTLREDVLPGAPLSYFESTVVIMQFLMATTQAIGGDLTAFAQGGFSLIREDDETIRWRQRNADAAKRAAANLPPGRVIGQPSTTAPQTGDAAAAS